eukprot:TRINITY_DN32794_c0_g1_i1.p1 TRINITY_DN32794_c0_g1~~TRINITY_DN32794_c0_g1_i1.p1  ORF type:complete len:630 (-),score=102.88 TRINITY_DN32794_c0_g1_i1:129-2018(-)
MAASAGSSGTAFVAVVGHPCKATVAAGLLPRQPGSDAAYLNLTRRYCNALALASLGIGAACNAKRHAGKFTKTLRARKKYLVSRMATGSSETTVPLAGVSLQAAMKMHCDTSGASYATYWVNVNGQLVVRSDYQSRARKEELRAKGFDESFATESQAFKLDPFGAGPVATVYSTKTPLLVKDIASSSMRRKELAAKYGIVQIAFIPFEAGVLELGTTEDRWEEMPEYPTLPNAELVRGFQEHNACYAIFWAKHGDSFEHTADFVTDSVKASVEAVRGCAENFCTESRHFSTNANSPGPVATAFRTGKEVTIVDSEFSALWSANLTRASLAKAFDIKYLHFIPAKEGVLEYGTRGHVCLSGAALSAALKMRCETSGAGYAVYWLETAGKLAHGGDHITPACKAALEANGITTSFADASKDLFLDASANGPASTVFKTRRPAFVQDASACTHEYFRSASSPEVKLRSDIAAQYGIKSVCFAAVPGGVFEFGTTDGTAVWSCLEDATKAYIPKVELQEAFSSGATHAIFWWKTGDVYSVGASYILPDHARALKALRNDDKTYASESAMVKLPGDDEGPLASAVRSGAEIVIDDPSIEPNFERGELANEFKVRKCHFVPNLYGVLEYGTSSIL